MKALRLVALTVALGCLTSGSALAQIEFEANIFGGGVFTVTDLGENVPAQVTLGGETFNIEFPAAFMDDGFMFGGSLGARFGQIGAEGEIMYWPSTQVAVTEGIFPGVETSFRANSNVLIAGGNVMYHITVSQDIAIEPYMTAGAGIKRYNTDLEGGTFFQEATILMWNVGLGAKFPISASTALRVDVRDYMSSFDKFEGADSKLQHDVIGKVGVGFAFGG